jgi:mannitol-1-phosphate/altronate dehydrogenase
MSNAQVIHFIGLIDTKLFQPRNSFRERLAHLTLYEKLWPIAAESMAELSQSNVVQDYATKEYQQALREGVAAWMKSFEHNLRIRALLKELSVLSIED